MAISFEFFPPKSVESNLELKKVRQELLLLSPEYFSVTFGAGGGIQHNTLKTVIDIQENDNIPAVPHISCIGTKKNELKEILDTYRANDINNLVVLRGDVPSFTPINSSKTSEFSYAYELVEFIREQFNNHFSIKVAAYPEKHPESINSKQDIEHFVNKIKAGADAAITQYFYNIDAYKYFVDAVVKKGVVVPIVPGIMPITNYSQLVKFSKFSGAEIPKWILNQLEYYQDDLPSLRAFGLEVVGNLCNQLKEFGVDDFHFYSMNRIEPAKTLIKEFL